MSYPFCIIILNHKYMSMWGNDYEILSEACLKLL